MRGVFDQLSSSSLLASHEGLCFVERVELADWLNAEKQNTHRSPPAFARCAVRHMLHQIIAHYNAQQCMQYANVCNGTAVLQHLLHPQRRTGIMIHIQAHVRVIIHSAPRFTVFVIRRPRMLLAERPLRSAFLFALFKFNFHSFTEAVSASDCTASNDRMLRWMVMWRRS